MSSDAVTDDDRKAHCKAWTEALFNPAETIGEDLEALIQEAHTKCWRSDTQHRIRMRYGNFVRTLGGEEETTGWQLSLPAAKAAGEWVIAGRIAGVGNGRDPAERSELSLDEEEDREKEKERMKSSAQDVADLFLPTFCEGTCRINLKRGSRQTLEDVVGKGARQTTVYDTFDEPAVTYRYVTGTRGVVGWEDKRPGEASGSSSA